MPFETYVVSTCKLSGSDGTPFVQRHPETKTAQEFREGIDEVYAKVSELGGRVISHEMTKLKVHFDNPNGDGGKGIIEPQDHAIIIAELPYRDLPFA